MKSIGLSDEVYEQLLHIKHMFEKEVGEVMSYDKVIRRLIGENGNGRKKDIN